MSASADARARTRATGYWTVLAGAVAGLLTTTAYADQASQPYGRLAMTRTRATGYWTVLAGAVAGLLTTRAYADQASLPYGRLAMARTRATGYWTVLAGAVAGLLTTTAYADQAGQPYGRLAMAGAVAGLLATTAYADQASLPYGRLAMPEEVAAWDVDIRPDGVGLPPGSASAADGEELFFERCAACHGEFGEGIDRWPVLMGGFDTLTDDRPEKTVGSYWPYASTLWDYIHRAMPFGEAQSLTDEEVYAVSLYVLYLNDLVELDDVHDQKSFAKIEMPNKDGFFMPDPRPDTPTAEPCMRDCDVASEIIGKARILDVTPDQKGDGSLVD